MQSKDVFELTKPQQSIWISEQFISDPINNIVGTMYFKKKNTDLKLLKQAVNLTVKNNEALRTRIFLDESTPKQFFEDFSQFDISITDLSSKSLEDFKERQIKFCQKSFNLLNDKLFEFVIFILPNDEIALIGKFHHIIVDAWSLGLVIDNIAFNYTNLKNSLNIDSNSGFYSDFIKRENQYLNSETYIKNKDFWLNKLENYNVLNIKNSQKNSFLANRELFELSETETNKINEFCAQNKISPYVLFLTILNIYLYRISSQEDFVITTPVLNRIGKEKSTIGMFINMISINMKNNSNDTILELLKKISTESINYFKNSKYPYMDLINNLRENNPDLNSTAYNLVFSFQNMRPNNSIDNLVPYTVEWNFVGYSQDELVINVTDINNSGRYSISYDYLVDLFETKEIAHLHTSLLTILSNVMDNPSVKLSEIEILEKTEKQKLLYDFNNSDVDYDKTKTLIDYFQEIVEKYPDNIALCYRDQKITYSQLNNYSNIMANKILAQGIENSSIAVLCKKSIWMIVTLLGILKSGNCYIPIDPEYPTDRVNYIIKNSLSKILITTKKYAEEYDFERTIVLDNVNYDDINCPNINNTTPDKLAYMIYTSGTTGAPKGVQIKHCNIINTLLWRKNEYKFDSSFVALQIPSFAFDSSVEDIFTPLLSGSTLVIPSVSKMDINIISEDIVKYKINHFLVVPSLYTILLNEKLDYLKTLKIVTIAGESCPISLVKEHFEKLPNTRLVNEYGPTENSVCSTFYEIQKEDTKVLIGKPINNCKCYCLDKDLNLLPIGVPGDLYVSGPGVSVGYFNNPEMTKDRFLKNPFGGNYNLYKTGDIVRFDFDGNLEYIGREDGQVKLNGFRIELKEIENVILESGLVSNAVVTVYKNSNGKNILVAHFTSYVKNLSIDDLSSILKQKLPYYMVPTLVRLDSFPLTPNGKINKKALPAPTIKNAKISLPRNELEKDILDICRDVLQDNNLGTHDNLFTAGNADSLSILAISSRLFAQDIKVRTQDFYKFSTVEQIANYVSIKDDKLFASHKYIVKPKITSKPENIYKADLNFEYKNVLLTGSTGFLGVHILSTLLRNTQAKVFCLIRPKGSKQPEERLLEQLQFYFGSLYYNNYKDRIVIIDGELSDEKFGLDDTFYNDLQNKIDCIINTAAITKHYGNYNLFYKENVTTVKNLIDFAKPNNILLNHISTTSVSGNFLVDNQISYTYTENDFYVGQNYEDNVYIHTKFEAERLVLEAEYSGLHANIFRLGNLMARYSDGIFQKNKFDNAYYTRLLALAELTFIPEQLKSQMLEFTPIDDVSNAIIKLLFIPGLHNKIFHLETDKLISIQCLLNVFANLNINCTFTSYDEFIKQLHSKEHQKILKYIISDLNSNNSFDYSSGIVISTKLTNSYLRKVGFNWHLIDAEYLIKFFDKVGFLKDLKN